MSAERRDTDDRTAPATLRDVAADAGVSVRTVSNVVTGAVPVSPDTRARVVDAVERLGYRPNLAARRLRSGRSHTIGLVLPDLTVPFFRELADSVLAAARARGHAVVIEQTDGLRDREREAVVSPRLRHVDGIVLAAIALGAAELAALRPAVPLVVAGASVSTSGVDRVAPDAVAAGAAVAEHLWASGRRLVAVVVPGNTDREPMEDDRYRGFLAEWTRLGGDVVPGSPLTSGAVNPQAGEIAVERLLRGAVRPDAVFLLGDAMALGALRGLRAAGVRVPEEIAVVGFGDVAQGAHSDPTLTTIDPGREEVARLAVDRLVDRLEGDVAAPRETVVPFRLIERESTRVRPA